MPGYFGPGGALDQERELEARIIQELAEQGIHAFSSQETAGKPYQTTIGNLLFEMMGNPRKVALYNQDNGVTYGFAVLIDQSGLAEIEKQGINRIRREETLDGIRKTTKEVEFDLESNSGLCITGEDNSRYIVKAVLEWYGPPQNTDIEGTAVKIEQVAGISRKLEEKYGAKLTATVVRRINGQVNTRNFKDMRMSTADRPEIIEQSPTPLNLQLYVVLSYQPQQQKGE